MWNKVLDALLGCAHRRTTFPLTPARKAGKTNNTRNGTYVVCLDCGREFDYNWQEMRIGEPVSVRVPASTAETLSPAHR
jgi:hypothetical protein